MPFATEMPVEVRESGARMREVPISYRRRVDGETKLNPLRDDARILSRLQNRRDFVRYGLGVGIGGLLAYLVANGVPPAEAASLGVYRRIAVPVAEAASYVIEKVGSTHYAHPAPNLGLSEVTPNTDAHTVIAGAIAALPNGGKIHLMGGGSESSPTYDLTDELVFNQGGGRYPFWILEGDGSVYIRQNTPGKNGFHIYNSTPVLLSNFRIDTGPDAASCIFFDKHGLDNVPSTQNSNLSDLIICGGSTSSPAVKMVNPMNSRFNDLYIGTLSGTSIPLEITNDASAVLYGNCTFDNLSIWGGQSEKCLYLHNVAGPGLDIISFSGLTQINGGSNTSVGVELGDLTHDIEFENIDIESYGTGIYVQGSSAANSSIGNRFLSGYIGTPGDCIHCGTNSWGNLFKNLTLKSGHYVFVDEGNYPNIYEDIFVIDYNKAAPGNAICRGGSYNPDTSAGCLSNSGVATFNGDGAKQYFDIQHRLIETVGDTPPRYYTAQKAAAKLPAIDYVVADPSKIRVYFVSAPSSGTGNVVIAWEAVL